MPPPWPSTQQVYRYRGKRREGSVVFYLLGRGKAWQEIKASQGKAIKQRNAIQKNKASEAKPWQGKAIKQDWSRQAKPS